MNTQEQFPSKWLTSKTLTGEQTLTVGEVTIETIGGDKQERPVVWFRETEKGWALNKTNARAVARLYGQEIDGWIGRKLSLFLQEVEYADGRILEKEVRMIEPTQK